MYTISNIYVLAAFGTIGGALFGFDVSSMSARIDQEQYLEYFNYPDSNLQGGLIVGRIVSGLAVGITSSQVCVYLAELAPGSIRGRIVGIQQWAIEWGILIMFLVAYGCAKGVSGPSAFRIAWGVQGIPAFVLLGSLFFFPESPRWLGSKGRWQEVENTLALLHANGNLDDPAVQAELLEIREAVAAAQHTEGVWQQLLDGNVAMYYIVYIFQMVGLGDQTLTSSIIQYVIFLVTTGLILPYIDKIPRRLLLTGSTICCICHLGLMANYGHSVDSINRNSILRWQVDDNTAAKGVIAVFPLKYRATGVGLSAATNWIFNFALAYFVAPAFTNITWKTYIIFGVFCFTMTFHIFFLYPETYGKTLEEIDVLFDANIPAWKSSQVKSRFSERFDTAVRKGSLTEHVENEADEKKSSEAAFQKESV
ncbi:general substrate transporter [Aureobasidium subglaciale]|nr:general substrate transporter [Aureobasidium subglaciale]KAI5226875.1 general substrate transporter [Aureobasidium subglaciale]KAI5230073.1 general substrate transporter [Aureobasidium subglaciale]KAI5264700.1 general substrate transporter [Aureobasidium subglaciale]